MKILKIYILPILIYFSIFFIYFKDSIPLFFTHAWTDQNDGSQMLWNLWWVKKAILNFDNFYFTDWIYYPIGANLMQHTLHPIGGIIYFFVSPIFSLIPAYNFLVITSYIFSGYAAFLLANYLSNNFYASLIAGLVYAFSPFHVAHTDGHLQQVLIEWIPFYVLFFLKARETFSIKSQLLASLFFIFIVLTDHYLTLYCVLFVIFFVIYEMIRERNIFKIIKLYLKMKYFIIISALVFIIFSLFTVIMNYSETMTGEHNPDYMSIDLLAPFIWSYHSLWVNVFKNIHPKFTGYPVESEAYIGLSLIILAIILFIKTYRNKILNTEVSFYKNIKFNFIFFLVFILLALGPSLKFMGRFIMDRSTPYYFLQKVIPVLKISGCPSRFMVMAYLFWGIFIALILSRVKMNRIIIIIIFIIVIIDFYPKPMITTPYVPLKWQQVLALDKNTKAGLDLSRTEHQAMRYQPVFEKKLAFGYISRTPQRLEDFKTNIRNEVENLKSKEEFMQFMKDNNYDFIVYKFDSTLGLNIKKWGLKEAVSDQELNMYLRASP